jgi:hypothetical protein
LRGTTWRSRSKRRRLVTSWKLDGVVAASDFLGIFGLRRGRETLRCLHM